MNKCKLSVNINKIATLRNSRGGNVPDLIQCATDLIRFGAEGITVHPRPDERHIKKADVFALKKLLARINKSRRESQKIEFNIEGYPSRDFMKLINTIRPEQATLVPDPPHVITSNAGWKIAKNKAFLKKIVAELKKINVRSSLFVDVFDFNEADFVALCSIQPDRIELYTEKYAHDFTLKKRIPTTRQYKRIAQKVAAAGIGINAGHDLNSKNLNYLLKEIPQIAECSIGHALIAESLYYGFTTTLKMYLKAMQ